MKILCTFQTDIKGQNQKILVKGQLPKPDKTVLLNRVYETTKMSEGFIQNAVHTMEKELGSHNSIIVFVGKLDE